MPLYDRDWRVPVRLLARGEEPRRSDICVVRERKRIFDIDAQISRGILNLYMSKQDLHGSQVAGGLVRVAAIERVRFGVTDFAPTASVKSDAASPASVYAALLIPVIRQLAAAE